MTKVRILPEILSNQIAAGEVVERPASIVKELIENCIDAKATQIIVEIEKGGKSLIRVSDNGVGLSRDDALLSIERYATSKISTTDDLFSISTMGFRGEALPSIASVSKFSMVTRSGYSTSGVKIEIAGGRLINVEDAGTPVGTMVEVKNLFYNTPARKKFLKTEGTEISHISDIISAIALGHPNIQIKLISNHRIQKNFTDLNNPFLRTASVLGEQTAKGLTQVAFDDGYVRVSGFTVNPAITRSSSNRIYFFVNRRLIYDRGLIAALFQGYRGRIMKGRYPMASIFVQIDFDQVDINVHPSKKEIKFYEPSRVYQAVATAVAEGFEAAQKDKDRYSAARVVSPDNNSSVKKKDVPHFEKLFAEPVGKVEQSVIEWTYPDEKKSLLKDENIPQTVQNPEILGDIPHEPAPVAPEPEKQPRQIAVIGQVMGTYIVAESDSGMMLVDQHAAHERIVFESLKKKHAEAGIIRQTLIVPETIELTHKEADCLKNMLDQLLSIGFEIEPFGGTTFVVKSIPVLISDRQIGSLIVDIIEKSMVDKNSYSHDQWLDDCLIMMACHHSIRANQKLTVPEMEKLIADLENCENPMHCPHGRPIVIIMAKQELEKKFKRVV